MKLAKLQVHIAQISCQMNGVVIAQVARNLIYAENGFLKGMTSFVCDNDPLFTREFEDLLGSSGMKLIRTRVGAPQQNGFAERFIKSLKVECLSRMIFFGEKSLRKAITDYAEHYHHERNHQGLENLIPFPHAAGNEGSCGSVVKPERLAKLLNYYYRENGKEVRKAA